MAEIIGLSILIVVGLLSIFMAYYLGHYIGYTDCEKDNRDGTNHRWWEQIIDKYFR